jgi:hypothetical protein
MSTANHARRPYDERELRAFLSRSTRRMAPITTTLTRKVASPARSEPTPNHTAIGNAPKITMAEFTKTF